MAIDNVAKVKIELDVSNVLSQITKIQEKLNTLSIKDLQKTISTQGFADIEKNANKATNAIERTTKSVNNVTKELAKAKKALSEYLQAHGKDIGYQDTSEYKSIIDNLAKAQSAYHNYNNVVKQISNENNPLKIAKSEQTATKVVKEEVEKQLSYKEQALKKEHEIAVKYANNGYPNTLSLVKDATTYESILNQDAQYQSFISAYQNTTYRKAIASLKNDIERRTYSEGNSYITSQDYKDDLNRLKSYLDAYKQLQTDIKALTEVKKEQLKVEEQLNPTLDAQLRTLRNTIQSNIANNANYYGSKQYQDDIAQAQNLYKQINNINSQIKNANQEIEKQPKVVNKATNEFKNYQTELARIERKAAVVFHELNQDNLGVDKAIKLRNELNNLTKEYQKLNKESVAFRKQVGISSSRGFYDLNSTYDYFLAKFRSKVTAGIAGQIEQFAMNAIPNFVDMMSTYQQNRVNFGQVLPNNLADDMNYMNNVMSQFTKTASAYGASVQDVVEAGRLWGRQYKDVAIVQELVRNTTKLSITDNMSLTEVNKGLEATLQQYAVTLKDANEASRVSGHIVDTWAKLADNAVVTASDLAKANEQSAGAANQMGISFDYLNAMIATMSGATGKAGAEIGRSIRSMLVSMNTPKAQQFFDSLGIATRELGTDGVMRIRSYEKVITELMLKLKNNPNDVSKGILALSGGKYQYNNVMALLKNYDQLMKNLQTAQNSSGWADAQVAQQYETISRQMKALNADIQQLVITLDKVGASAGITEVINFTREIVKVLSNISPENVNLMTRTANELLKILVLLKGLSLLSTIKINLSGIITYLRALPSILQAVRGNILGVSSAIAMLTRVTGMIGALVLVGQAVYTIYDAINTTNKNASTENLRKQIRDLSSNIDELQTAVLNEMLDADALARISSAKNTQEAIDKEIDSQKRLKIISNSALQQRIADELATTETVISNVETRIEAYKREMEYFSQVAQVRFQEYRDAYNDYQQNWANREDSIAKDMVLADLDRKRKAYQEMQNKASASVYAYGSQQNNLADLRNKQTKLINLANGIITVDGTNNIKGQSGAIVGNTDDTKKGGNTGSSKTDYNALSNVLDLQQRYNKLLYEAKQSQTEYNTKIKELNTASEYSKDIQGDIVKYQEVYGNRLSEIQDEESKLVGFRDELIARLDEEVVKHQDIIDKTKYTTDGTIQFKLENIEVNKELYSQERHLNEIANKINAVNNQIANTKKKYQEVSAEQTRALVNVPRNNYTNAVNANDTNYNIQSANLSILPFDTLSQNSLRLNNLRLNYAEQIKLLREYEAQKAEIQDNGTQEQLAMLDNALQETREKMAQSKAEIYKLEHDEQIKFAQSLSQNMTTQFSNMLLQGQSFSDTMKNIWADLTSYIIQRLLQVYVFEQLTNLIFPTKHTGGNIGAGSKTQGAKAPSSHTGSVIAGYPKMHSGGMVAQGRLGVVPKLKNDEVIRTLQVGEEVNSIQDRRSNEILATVAMKAIDARNQQPNNVNIMALDSRSFAEYLNDNADILTAVLAKQGALGRRS